LLDKLGARSPVLEFSAYIRYIEGWLRSNKSLLYLTFFIWLKPPLLLLQPSVLPLCFTAIS
jgi:hypothetical protein